MGSFFVWDVGPQVFSFSDFPRWYSLMFATGLYGGYWIVEYFWRLAKDPIRSHEAVQSLMLYVVVGTVVGMRLAHCFFYDFEYFSQHPLEILMLWKGGYASHGGFAGVLLGTYYFTKRFPGTSFLEIADHVSIGAMCTSGFIRVGNFFNSEMIGHPTTAPWAVIFARIDAAPRHPTQIYEAIGYFAICGLGFFMAQRGTLGDVKGRIFGFILASSASWRFFCEFFKEDQSGFEKDMLINMGQVLSIPFILAGLWLLLRRRAK